MKFYDDDMDDLFNKAGRDYPLKTEPKDWDAVHGALLPENGVAEITQKRTGWRRLLPLLFLLLIPAVFVFIDRDNVNKENTAVAHNADKTADKIAAPDKNTKNAAISNSQQSVKADVPAVTKIETENTNKNSDREVSRLSYVPPAKQILRNVAKVDEESDKVKGGLSGPPQVGVKVDSEVYNSDPASWNNFPSLNTAFNAKKKPSEAISMNTPVRSLNQSSGLKSVPNSDKKNKNRKGLYYGVIAGPDLSTIKGQEVKGIGYSAGAIVGYSINNHWQVEGGIMWSRKKYYTDGKYFSKEGAQIPANVNVHWLNGGCEMLEFPVVARYNFSEKKNTFFGSAGLTSYMMKKEDYDYFAEAGAGGYTYKGYREYKHSGDHLFANLQLSAGYNFSLSSKLNIRIEPYLKTPLKKIGIGKMPVTSTGVYFAITRDFR